MKIEEIEKRCEAATPGPWEWFDTIVVNPDGWKRSFPCGGFASPETCVCHFGDDEPYYPTEGDSPREEDRTFIAHSRTDLPALLSWAKRARDVLDDIGCPNPVDCEKDCRLCKLLEELT